MQFGAILILDFPCIKTLMDEIFFRGVYSKTTFPVRTDSSQANAIRKLFTASCM